MGGPVGYDGGKKIKGRKRHILADTLGLLLAVVVTAANLDDGTYASMVLGKLTAENAEPGLRVRISIPLLSTPAIQAGSVIPADVAS